MKEEGEKLEPRIVGLLNLSSEITIGRTSGVSVQRPEGRNRYG